ncbi:hypothetical protein [Hyperthermus butylicus]|uniref:Conserved crenarchaeal protein n=1 Tax=Hyperthermus butylicus (strain DSM 5456 / JCM 9403 / PLM1-5) TaxID=415426 RepID=A2BM39_HYPBU|nr:hypothetical protein [Hyperthermus butylicus]ABM81050.1 conserved crenarchaeal protein [Hyperthermus butylicus DSM 5456]
MSSQYGWSDRASWHEEVAETSGQERRQGPRSRIVEAIAVLLLARPMRAAEIAQVLGKPTRYVSSYLSYWRTRGLFEYENGFWTLTEKGEEFARSILEREMNSRVAQYAALARQILEQEQVSSTINNNTSTGPRLLSGRIQPFIAAYTGKTGKKRRKQGLPRSACIQAILADLEIDEEERAILEHMLNHYLQWGTSYTYLDQLEHDLEADRVWLLTVLRRLQTKGIMYIYNDRRLGIRVGLSKRLKEFVIATCQPSSQV